MSLPAISSDSQTATRLEVRVIDRQPARAADAGDESLVNARPVQVGAPDRVHATIRPIDACRVDRDCGHANGTGDEALIGTRPIVQRAANRVATGICPVDVRIGAGGPAQAEREHSHDEYARQPGTSRDVAKRTSQIRLGRGAPARQRRGAEDEGEGDFELVELARRRDLPVDVADPD